MVTRDYTLGLSRRPRLASSLSDEVTQLVDVVATVALRDNTFALSRQGVEMELAAGDTNWSERKKEL
ncbi:hypothetical protein BSKO_01793 [Bryopsis sp. KO-2023]|nr:hypothetical protein BSKO_01793 [Bryopsis sp. KO-2023]